MIHPLRPAVASLLAMTALTGVAYPLLVAGLGWALFPRRAGGSLLHREGRAVGSQWIAQAFMDPGDFWSRPSATTAPAGKALPFNAANSGGSNLGPLDPVLRKAVEDRVAVLKAADPGQGEAIPADLVTASGSGLDPHISPAAAFYQVGRVARARGLDEARVRALVERQTEGPQVGFLGEARVNVLELNLALDALRGGPRP